MMASFDPAFLFRLHVNILQGEPAIVIRAWDDPDPFRSGPYHAPMILEVRQGGKVIFPKGSLRCAVSLAAGHSTDGDDAKELAMSCAAMKPGDTDDEYFKDYTPEQIAWASKYGEHLSLEAELRYGER